MIKVFLKYFLFSSVLFLSNLKNLHAHTDQNCIYANSLKPYGISILMDFEGMKPNVQAIKESVSSDQANENDDLNALLLYDDDDESISFKKHLENSHYSTSVFSNQTSGCSFNYSGQITVFYKELFYIPSCRYLLFHVFRL